MPAIFERLNKKKARDVRVLADFVAIYCREQHGAAPKSEFPIHDERLKQALGTRSPALCQDCARLLNHGIAKLMLCPYDPKPVCRKCKTHCYAPDYRQKMRAVMKFSGMYLIRHGRLDLLLHYFA